MKFHYDSQCFPNKIGIHQITLMQISISTNISDKYSISITACYINLRFKISSLIWCCVIYCKAKVVNHI